MFPTINGRGDYLLISRRYNHGKGIEVGDLVRFYHPSFAGMHAAKRVLGMPGDFVCKDLAYSGHAGETGEMIQVRLGIFICVTMTWMVVNRGGCRFFRFPKAMSILPVITCLGREILEFLVRSRWVLLMERLLLLSGLHGG